MKKGDTGIFWLKLNGIVVELLAVFTGKNLWFPIYVYNMVSGCLFNVFDETHKRNNF